MNFFDGLDNFLDIVYTSIYSYGQMFFYEVCDAFHFARVPFVVVGGYAMALHGMVRATMDVDLVLNLKLEDFEKAERVLGELGLKSRIPVRAQDIIKMREEYIKQRNLIVWSFVDYKNTTRQIDILINKNLKDLEVEVLSFAGRKIPVVSLVELARLKKEAGRPQDLLDLENIKRILDEKK